MLLIAGFIFANASQAQETARPPQISIYSPGPGGAPIYGNHLLVQAQVSNFSLDGRLINKDAPATTGYWILTIDGAYAGLAASDMIMAPNAAYTRIAPGSHHIKIELVTSKGQPLDPPAYAEADVNIGQEMVYAPPTSGTPDATIILPSDGAMVNAEQAYIKVRLNNITLDGRAVNGANQPGVGHWIATVDGQYAGLSMSEILMLPSDMLYTLGPGRHRLEVTLVQNDGTPLTSAQPSAVTVEFTPAPGTATATPTSGPQLLPPSATPTGETRARSTCPGASLYFDAVQHAICAPFRDFWESNGGLKQFGYPLTEQFDEVSPTDGMTYTVQYFERNRFEYHPEISDPAQQVQLGLLGRQFHTPDPPVPALDRPDAEWFAATGHNLSGAFRRYWHSYGGLPIYGYPISEQFQEKSPTDGKTYTVQYFERARFEYHPEIGDPTQQVQLGLLGVQALHGRSTE